MPRYFFHVCNGDGLSADLEGQELPDLDAARAAAVVGARDIMAAEIKRGMLSPMSYIVVEDAMGRHQLTLAFEDAYEVRLPG